MAATHRAAPPAAGIAVDPLRPRRRLQRGPRSHPRSSQDGGGARPVGCFTSQRQTLVKTGSSKLEVFGIELSGATLIGKNINIGASGTSGPNTIAFNSRAGVLDTLGATIRFSEIFSNGGLGIDHSIPTNDAPILTGVVSDSTTTKISATINDFFAGTAIDTIVSTPISCAIHLAPAKAPAISAVSR